ncbi:hypothetical protein HB364_32035 [Pseudoflavitalea sp. X16]|uniref:ATP-binding protein n=1 Tax=Paraflavitalea devenefica TaxID=2716334 RepID=UPI001421E8E6|nr:ATP-binding protein [Paraflavitalea devenefica]NII29752.1 hypothetical protein [Paraflavitalea devenefica]
MANIEITGKGIQKVLSRFDYRQAIAEYIWNGFDAKATTVQLNYEANNLGFIAKMEIIDNGYGIHRSQLAEKFSPFFDSQKAIEIDSPKNTSAVHGKNGVGRLTFFKFAAEAIWNTVYEEKKKKYEYFINIKFETINKYDSPDSGVWEVKKKTGTTVTFYNILPDIVDSKLQEELGEFLCLEFGWYLELNKENGYALLINGVPLDYAAIIGDTHHFMLNHEDSNNQFEVKYIRWNAKINKEFSKYYYIGADNRERYKEFTSLNNKGDHFYHSVYIKSTYFNQFKFKGSNTDPQLAFIGSTRIDPVFRFLHKRLSAFLLDKRKPYLKQYTDILISQYEQDDIFPVFSDNPWDVHRKIELENLVRGLYEVQPKIFLNLNTEQKKTFVRLLNLLLDSLERDKLFDILDGVVELSHAERKQMAEIIKVTRLARVNHTIRLIEDRYKTIDTLRDLIIRKELKANERDHLQKLVEAHYWIFGEQYHLVTAAEPKFEEALRRHVYLLRGDAQVRSIDHEDKYREMDIFLCRQDILTNEIRNIVVELKHPALKLGEQELTQVKKYMNVIMNEPQFNGNNMGWEFYLIGADFNNKGEIAAALDNARPHGEKSLAFKTGQYKIFVKKWSEVINDFEMKHKFLNDKLQLERKSLNEAPDTAAQALKSATSNTAAIQRKIV